MASEMNTLFEDKYFKVTATLSELHIMTVRLDVKVGLPTTLNETQFGVPRELDSKGISKQVNSAAKQLINDTIGGVLTKSTEWAID